MISLFSHFQFDTNGDGQISTAELREAMKKLLGQQVQRCRESLSSIDQCLSHLVRLLWVCATRVHTFVPRTLFQVGHRDLEDILRDIDLNGDGHVDFEGKYNPVQCVMVYSTLQYIKHFTAARAWNYNVLTQPLVYLSHPPLCWTLSYARTFQVQAKILTCSMLISKCHAEFEVRGWKQEVWLSD